MQSTHPKRAGLIIRAVLLSLLGAVLSACSADSDMNDLRQYISEVALRSGGPVPPLPDAIPYAAFVYSAASMRSPFEVPVMAGAHAAQAGLTRVQPDFDRKPEALEAFALSSLAMVGTITRGRATLALLRDVDGLIYRVGIGGYVGRNHGRVAGVSDKGVELIEIVPSGGGAWVERRRTLALQDERHGAGNAVNSGEPR